MRAGCISRCADLFADLDLQADARVYHVLADNYPHGLIRKEWACGCSAALYTGGLENHPECVRDLEALLPVWGNPSAVLSKLRNPELTTALFCEAGLHAPRIKIPPRRPDPDVAWLWKPYHGAGGRGIVRHANAGPPFEKFVRDGYFQQLVDGVPCSACYVGFPEGARRLCFTRQLVGESFCNAPPFHYCGSVGPIEIDSGAGKLIDRAADLLATRLKCRGLFGIDFVLDKAVAHPVEVNPRYTASIEVWERSTGRSAFASYLDDGFAESAGNACSPCVIGKAILFAAQECRIKPDAPCYQRQAVGPQGQYADVPRTERVHQPGDPILTLFVKGRSDVECRRLLQQRLAYFEATYLQQPNSG